MSNQKASPANRGSSSNKISIPYGILIFIHFGLIVAFTVYQTVGLITNGPNFWNFLFLGFIVALFLQSKYPAGLVHHFLKIVDTIFEVTVIGYSLLDLLYHGGGFWDILFGLFFASTFAVNAVSGFTDDPFHFVSHSAGQTENS